MTLRAAGYLRVSSLAQRDRVTIESQRRDVPAYIDSQGWTLAGLYEDDGRTAKAGHLDARDGFARLLADAKAGRFDVVVVVSVDRLTRSEDPVERAQVVASITAAGAKVAIVGAGIQDPRTFAGDAYLTLQALFAAEENRRRRERTIAGHITAAGRGRKPRGWTPYGLTYDPRTGAWGVDEPAAAVVREILRRVAEDEPSGTIGADLERRAIRRPRGGRWTSERVRGVVASDVYLGRFVVDRVRGLSLAVPAIADADVVELARQRLADRYRKPGPRVVYHHLLVGLAVCNLCHATVGLAGTTDRRTGEQPTAYRCTHRRYPPPGKERCALPLLRTVATDEIVWREVGDAIGRKDVVERFLAGREAKPAEDPAKHRAELDRLDRLQDAILSQQVRGIVSPEVAEANLTRLAKQRQAASVALKLAESSLRLAMPAEAVEEHLRLLRLGLEHAPADRRPAIIQALVERVVVGERLIAIDLSIDVPTSPAAGSSGRPALPVTLPGGRIRTLVRHLRAA